MLKSKIFHALILVLLALPCALQAQDKTVTVTGNVKDENGEPMIGALVSTDAGAKAITDINGFYSITIPESKAVLKFSYMGYTTQEILVGGRTKINVDLKVDTNNNLNEVVVIGYGTQKKADLTGSVAVVNMKDLSESSVPSIDQALQGRIAGVDIMSTSGDPGASTSVRIRGTRSINASNEPLIVLDGVIDAVSDINEINPADIESISVMKDASSTAIYGSRGANGVILVTTKKGVTSKPSVSFKAEFGASQIARYLDTMNKDEFVSYLNDRYYFNSSGSTAAPRFDAESFKNDTDWLKEITRLAPYQNYDLSASGRIAEKFKYYASISYNDNQGIIKNSGSTRFTARVNLDYDVAKWLSVGIRTSLALRTDNQNKAAIGGTNWYNGAIYLSPIIGPNDIYNPLYENGTSINTPITMIEQIDLIRQMITNNNALIFTFRPCKGLTIRSQNSLMIYQRHDYQFWPSTLPNRVEGQGADAYRYEGDAQKWSTENTVTYARKFSGGNNFDAMAGFSASSDSRNYFSLKALGLLSDELTWNNMAGIVSKENLTPSTSSETVVKESVFARVNYNYKQRYYITATGRFDGSSNFASNNKWGFFPSAAVKWAVKQEPFMRNVRWIDELSLRISGGRTGNDAISPLRSLAAYSTTTSSYLFDGTQGASVYPARVANPDLTWEKTTLYNVALDMSFLKNRIRVSLEGYYSHTNDLLLNLKTIQTTGYDSRLTNLGVTSNKGVEFTIDTRNIVKRNFGWNTQLTITHNKQMVEDIGQEDYVAVLNSPGNAPFMMYGYKTGYPLNSLWGFQYAGIFHSQEEYDRNKVTKTYITNTSSTSPVGYPKYVDQDHDGVLTSNDLIYLGNSDPVLYGGLNNTFKWGNFDFGFFFSYSLGGKIYNYSELYMSGSYSTNQYRYMIDAWHPVRNPDSDLPRAGTSAVMLPSSFMAHDASYLRLKNAYIKYTFDLSKKTRALRDITIGISGNNLFLISDYNGFDPDVSTSSESTLRRVDMGAYPQSRRVIFSLQIRY